VKLIAAVAVALLAQAAASPVRILDQGAQSGVHERRTVAVDSAAEFSTLWRKHTSRPAPTIDFARESVVALFLGTRNTSGYRVEIVGIDREASGSVVRYRETAPPADAITAQVITYPFVIAAVQRLTGPVRFEAVK
jgi:hypothetical protein